MKLNLMRLSQRLLKGNMRFALVRYIFKIQGAEWRRLDFEAAAKALLIDRKTVSRYVNELSDPEVHILQLRKNGRNAELKISEEFLGAMPA